MFGRGISDRRGVPAAGKKGIGTSIYAVMAILPRIVAVLSTDRWPAGRFEL